MADVIGLSNVSSKDTGKGSKLKTGGLNRSNNMATPEGKPTESAECHVNEVYNKKLKRCVPKGQKVGGSTKSKKPKLVGK
jgi:hypothetical protein